MISDIASTNIITSTHGSQKVSRRNQICVRLFCQNATISFVDLSPAPNDVVAASKQPNEYVEILQ